MMQYALKSPSLHDAHLMVMTDRNDCARNPARYNIRNDIPVHMRAREMGSVQAASGLLNTLSESHFSGCWLHTSPGG